MTSAMAVGRVEPSTQGANDDLDDGSVREDDPEHAPPPRKKQNVERSVKTAQCKVLMKKKQTAQHKKDPRGGRLARCAIHQPHTSLLV